MLTPPVEVLAALRDELASQMAAGLAGGPRGLMMLPSYVDVLPSGHETGDCYSVDLGGTNLRVMHVRLGAERGVVVSAGRGAWVGWGGRGGRGETGGDPIARSTNVRVACTLLGCWRAAHNRVDAAHPVPPPPTPPPTPPRSRPPHDRRRART